jgi:hypothetical protein
MAINRADLDYSLSNTKCIFFLNNNKNNNSWKIVLNCHLSQKFKLIIRNSKFNHSINTLIFSLTCGLKLTLNKRGQHVIFDQWNTQIFQLKKKLKFKIQTFDLRYNIILKRHLSQKLKRIINNKFNYLTNILTHTYKENLDFRDNYTTGPWSLPKLQITSCGLWYKKFMECSCGKLQLRIIL